MPSEQENNDSNYPTSGLSESITAEAVAAATAAAAEAERQERLSNMDDLDSSHHGVGHLVAPTPEQYILSHLQDSASFSSFYPPATEDIDPSLRSQDETAGEQRAVEPPQETQHEDGDEAARQQADRLSVLSRWKKGGPDSCDICSRTQTSVWRKLVFNGEDLKVCNGE